MMRASNGKERVSVAFLLESLGPGGAERQLVELLRHLDQERFSARVLTYFPDDFYRREVEELGVPVHYVGRRGKVDCRVLLKVARWLWRAEVDVVHATGVAATVYAVVARALAGRGGVLVWQTTCPTDGSWQFWRGRRWIHRHADVTIANSRAGARIVEERVGLGIGTVRFIPNMLDAKTWHPATDEERERLRKAFGWERGERVVLTVGTFSRYKNHLGITEALEGLPGSSRLRFCWVGAQSEGDLARSVRERLEAIGMNGRVEILGLQPSVTDFYRACDVFLLNSIEEGTPNVILEALACGCPVIATDVSDMGLYVQSGRTGWLIPPNDTRSLRRALAEMDRADTDKLRAMGLEARRTFAELGCDPAEVAARYESVYNELYG